MRKKVKTQKFYRYFDKGCLEPFAGKRFPKTFPARNDHRSLHFGSLLGRTFHNGHLIKIPNVFRAFSLLRHSHVPGTGPTSATVAKLRLVDGVKIHKVRRVRNFSRQYLFFRVTIKIFSYFSMAGDRVREGKCFSTLERRNLT